MLLLAVGTHARKDAARVVAAVIAFIEDSETPKSHMSTQPTPLFEFII